MQRRITMSVLGGDSGRGVTEDTDKKNVRMGGTGRRSLCYCFAHSQRILRIPLRLVFAGSHRIEYRQRTGWIHSEYHAPALRDPPSNERRMLMCVYLSGKCVCAEGGCKTGCTCTSCRCAPCQKCEYKAFSFTIIIIVGHNRRFLHISGENILWKIGL